MLFGIDSEIISQTTSLDVNPVAMVYGKCLTPVISYYW